MHDDMMIIVWRNYIYLREFVYTTQLKVYNTIKFHCYQYYIFTYSIYDNIVFFLFVVLFN